MQTIFNIGFLGSTVISTIWMVTGSDIAIALLKKMPIESSLKIQIETMIVIDDSIGEIFLFISFPLLRFNYVLQQNFYLVLRGTLEEVLLSIILGIFLGYVIHKFFKFAYNKLPQVISSFAFILLVVRLSEYLNLHSIVVALISGIVFTLSSKFEVVKK
jgi:NhaP-type Na+/H+ or K+/H+ antiporter